VPSNKSTYQWYLEPLSDWTNEVFWKNGCAVKKEAAATECTDGQQHNLLECKYVFLRTLQNSNWMRLKLGVDFKIWNQKTRGSKIRNVTDAPFFHKKKKQYHIKRGSELIH
jgi:hypothetical protein